MSETSRRTTTGEAIKSMASKNIIRLITLTQETLDAKGVQAEGADQARTLSKTGLAHGDSTLQETFNPETGLKEYEYSEIRSTDPTDPHGMRIYRWSEGGDKVTILRGPSEEGAAEPTVISENFALDDTNAHIQGRIRQLKTLT